MNSINSMPELTHLNKELSVIPPSNIERLKELSNYLVETESMLSAFWLLSPTLKVVAKKGEFIKINPVWKTCLGYEPEELLGKNYIEFVHPDDIHDTLNFEIDLSLGNSVKKFRNRYLHKYTKKWITLEWYSRQDEYSGLIFATALDKTFEEEQNYQLLNLITENLKEKDKFKHALDLATIGIFLTDKNGLCTYVNQKYLELTGLSFDECIGRGWEDGLCDTEKDRVIAERYSYTENLKTTKEFIPFQTDSCYHNKIIDKRTPVKIYAYFYDDESCISYATIIPYSENGDV